MRPPRRSTRTHTRPCLGRTCSAMCAMSAVARPRQKALVEDSVDTGRDSQGFGMSADGQRP